jgi:hypothetical protein
LEWWRTGKLYRDAIGKVQLRRLVKVKYKRVPVWKDGVFDVQSQPSDTQGLAEQVGDRGPQPDQSS